MRKLLILLSAALFVAGTAACATESTSDIAVDTTDSTCVTSRAEADPGRVKLNIDNQGTRTTEVYVYAPGDRTIGEVEFIDAGKKGTLTVELGGGDYEVTCKPGMGELAFRAPLHITGPVKPTSSEDLPDRATSRGQDTVVVAIDALDDKFALIPKLAIVKGQTVIFELRNGSSKPHQLQILGPDGAVLGEIPVTAPGASATLTLPFSTLGTYRYVDPSAGPEVQAASGTFEVIN